MALLLFQITDGIRKCLARPFVSLAALCAPPTSPCPSSCVPLPAPPWFFESGVRSDLLGKMLSHSPPFHISSVSPNFPRLSGSLTLVDDISSYPRVTIWLLHCQHHIYFPGRRRRKENEAKEQRWSFFQQSFDSLFRKGSSLQNKTSYLLQHTHISNWLEVGRLQ